jgi:hypothetical protein
MMTRVTYLPEELSNHTNQNEAVAKNLPSRKLSLSARLARDKRSDEGRY